MDKQNAQLADLKQTHFPARYEQPYMVYEREH